MVKPREHRVPIMMSDEELKAVDDFRYDNRIATRSEAIRRLTKAGLGMQNEAIALHDLFSEILEDAHQKEEEIGAFLERLNPDNAPINRQEAMEIALLYATLIANGDYDHVWKLYERYVELLKACGFPVSETDATFSVAIHEKALSMLRHLLKRSDD